jgi:hypothetical protein
MTKGTVHLCVGLYHDLETAEADYADLKRLHGEGLVGAYDAAVVARQDDGTVAVEERKKDTARGAWSGLGIGALAGLLFPPAILGAALVGAARSERSFLRPTPSSSAPPCEIMRWRWQWSATPPCSSASSKCCRGRRGASPKSSS